MKALNLITLLLIIVGGLDLGMRAFTQTDFIASAFGAGSTTAAIAYGLVGLSALWQLMPLVEAMRTTEPMAEAHVRNVRPLSR
jgi:uncharacterized membrane protein YuzA (DUF378 family)